MSTIILNALASANAADLAILNLATEDTGKFAIEVGYPLTVSEQEALERGMAKDWYRLIDVTTRLAAAPSGSLVRVFLLTDVGRYRRAVLRGERPA
jgi:hypothetical protein